MSVYEICRTHMRPWSNREMRWFLILLLLLLVWMAIGYRQKRYEGVQVIVALVGVVYLTFVFATTLFTRESTRERQYQLELFWSWKKIWAHDRTAGEEVFLNCLLLAPIGMLLPLWKREQEKVWKALLLGLAISVFIEGNQLFFCRGLFEWDDMIHNSLGCMMGCILMNCILKIRGKRREDRKG